MDATQKEAGQSREKMPCSMLFKVRQREYRSVAGLRGFGSVPFRKPAQSQQKCARHQGSYTNPARTQARAPGTRAGLRPSRHPDPQAPGRTPDPPRSQSAPNSRHEEPGTPAATPLQAPHLLRNVHRRHLRRHLPPTHAAQRPVQAGQRAAQGLDAALRVQGAEAGSSFSMGHAAEQGSGRQHWRLPCTSGQEQRVQMPPAWAVQGGAMASPKGYASSLCTMPSSSLADVQGKLSCDRCPHKFL